MAGVVGSTPTRPTTSLSIRYSGNGKLLAPLQRGCNAAAALQLCSFRSFNFFLSRHLIYRCCAFVNCLVPFKNCCSVELRKKESHLEEGCSIGLIAVSIFLGPLLCSA